MTFDAPLLDGALAGEAHRRIAELGDALARPFDRWDIARDAPKNGVRTTSLALGRSGIALFHAWRFAALGEAAAKEHALAFLSEAIERIPEETLDHSLFCGFPGIAWTTEHVLRVTGEAGDDDPVADIDATLLDAFADPGFRPDFDLIGGLAGLGVLALERRARPTGPALAGAVLDHLERLARPQSAGLSWPSGELTRRALADHVAPEDTYFNLGLSHGVPGVLAILARLASFPELRARAHRLLAAGAAWLAAQRLPAGAAGAFPDYVAHDIVPEPARVAWCYGDPGVAAAFAAAGESLDDRALRAFALDVAHAAARRPVESSGVVDAGLCHGAAGVAHVFHRLWRASGDPVCRDAALAWFERALERVADRPNVAGFATFGFERRREGEYVEDPGLLTGAAGTGLALVAAVSRRAPEWDRFLLLDSAG